MKIYLVEKFDAAVFGGGKAAFSAFRFLPWTVSGPLGPSSSLEAIKGRPRPNFFGGSNGFF